MITEEYEIYLNQLQELRNLNMIKSGMHINLPSVKLSSKRLQDNERKLVELNKTIRSKWRLKVGCHISSVYKSTLWGTNISDLQNYKYHYSYETLLNDENDFADLLGYSIDGMNNKTFLFSSGMATISHILYCFSSFLKNSLRIQASVGYFETKYFLKILASMGNKVYLDFNSNVNANLFYFEPIKYDATLSVTNIDLLIRRINESTANLKFVVMDSTMHNKTRLLNYLISNIKNTRNIIFCDLRSGLKLDQEGLELTNLGIATIFSSNLNNGLFESVKRYVEQYKSLTGANLSAYSLMLSHYFNNKFDASDYTKQVIKQVQWTVNSLKIENSSVIKKIIFKDINYKNEHLVSPFIFIELYTDVEQDYLNTIKSFQEKMRENGSPIEYRNSWGFRFPSVEYFNDVFSNKKYVKYYPGMFKGLTANNALKIFNTI